MSWLNLNQSFNSLKGQITNFASEVLSENPDEDIVDGASVTDSGVTELETRCRNQELEIASLKKLTDELQTSLTSERLSRKNGIKEEESSWYWDPPPQNQRNPEDVENKYKLQIRSLQDEISTMRERDTVDLRPDTDEELHRLKEENRNLTANLEDLDSQHQLAMERLLTLKKELQKNFEVLKQEHEDLKNSNDEYGAEIKSLLSKIGERDKEILDLKNSKADYETLYHKYQNLERVHSLLKENAEKFQEENQELHEEVFRLQEQVTKMEHEIEIASKQPDLSDMVPRERYEELLKEMNDLRSRRHSTRDNFDEINIDDNAKSVIENLKRDINELKHKLSQKNTDVEEHDANKIIRPERIMQLYNKYVNFELPVDYVGEIPSSGDNIVLYKLESVFKTVNSFKRDIDTLEQKLSEKNLNINHLQAQIDDLTTENDFLSTDLQHFEGELNDMKKNNDFLINEIAALKNTSKLEPIIETHEDNYAKMENELADCNRMNKTFESEIKRIEKELAAVVNEKTHLQASLNDLKTKYTTMLNELEMCKNQTKEVEELESSTNQHQFEKMKKTAEEIDDLKKRLHASNAKNEQMSIDIHIIENDKVLLTKKIDDLKNSLEEKSSAHKELESLKAALDHKLHDFEGKLDEVIKHKQTIENDKVNLEQQVTVLETKLASKVESSTSSDLESITTEKMLLSDKLDVIVHENSTLIDTIEKLRSEVIVLQKQKHELLTENGNLKNNTKAEMMGSLKQIIDDLKAKVIQQEDLSNEIASFKDEKHKLIEKKIQLEAELSSTDTKIVRLEEEFDKLITDMNEKDTIIDSLNLTVNQSNASLSSLNQNVADLENSVSIKNDEILRLKQSLDDISKKLNDSNQLSSHSKDELNHLHTEKEEISKQIYSLTDEVNSKNAQISNLTIRLEDVEKTCQEYKVTIGNKDKEIKELNQSIVELADKIKVTDNSTHQNDEYAKLVQDKETIEKEVVELKTILVVREKELLEMTARSEQFEKAFGEYKSALDNATAEKTELINLITLKHNESIQYHNEIQRLNHVLLEQSNEFKRVIEEKNSSIQNRSDACSNCEILRATLKEKDEIIMTLNQNVTDLERIKAELSFANESLKTLTEKCNNLDNSLTTQLEIVKKLTAENAQLSELEQNSVRELERLRHHLMETEEAYTQELMTSEQKLTECQVRLQQVEDRAKQTSTVYTSNSIRANQEVETLRNQIKLLEKQREEVQAKLSEADDARIRSEAALTNLQVVLEQFQLDKEREIQAVTEKIRNKTEEIKRQNHELHNEIARLNGKLEESLAGLQAATRLGDQVETKTAQINDLKEQVRTLQTSVAGAEERYYNAISNQQDKIDKNLVKNLVINYVQTAAHSNVNKTQVLRILSTVLDFNQQECEKLGLVKSSTTPDSLAAEFVKFLQNESRPRPPLPNMMGLTQNSSRSTTPTSRKSSTAGPHPSPIELGHKRNPSTGSNNLLFQNIDSLDTASHVSRESDEPRVVPTIMDTGVNQTRNTEGAILKYVLKDM